MSYTKQNFVDGQVLKASHLNHIEEGIARIDNSGAVDLVMFMGQSNMAGRGVASEAPNVVDGTGYEFRAISDPTRLYPITEPFGVNENNATSGVSETSKTGSMVSAFANEYYKYTHTPIVGVSCSIGGTSVDWWKPSGKPLNDAISRHNAAKTWLNANGYTVRHDFMVWCQGETDGDNGTEPHVYIETMKSIIEAMMQAGVEKCFVVRIGNHKTKSTLYDNIIEAQTELCRTYNNAVLVSTDFARMAADGLMKDAFHYTQEGYNITGSSAGKHTAFYVNNGVEPYMYDHEYGNLYFPYATINQGENGENIEYLFNLDFTKKSLATYVAEDIVDLSNDAITSTHTSEGDVLSMPSGSCLALVNSLTFPDNFEIQLRLKTDSTYRDEAGYGLGLFCANGGKRPMLNFRSYQKGDGGIEGHICYQSRLTAVDGDSFTITDLGIPVKDNVFHDVVIHYEGTSVWMSVDGVRSGTFTTARDANTVENMFGLHGVGSYSWTHGITLAYVRVVGL